MKQTARTAVITGGGSGIGAACAFALADEGFRVAIAGRRAETLRETAANYRGDGEILTHAVNVADRPSVDALFRWADEQLGRVDVLINSAGVNVPNRSLEELEPDDWDRILAVNATGAYNCIRAVLPQMRRRGDGLILNVSSIAGIRASQLGGPAYSVSKFAMTALGRNVALAEREHGIRVTNILPGEVETPILAQRPEPVTDEHRRRILQPEDIAIAVVMLTRLPPRAHVPDLVIKPTTQPLT
ncbi:MAG: SDR family oxidoreductase [Planctomycetaceae bacterium]